MTESKEYTEALVKGSIIGLLVGDALAYPYRNVDHNKLPLGAALEMKASQYLPGTFTYGGSKMLCAIANINDFGELNLEDLLDKLDTFYITGYMSCDEECKELDMNTIKAIKSHKLGTPPDRCGPNEESTTDSDSLTMLLPVALRYANDDNLVDIAHELSKITHGHIRNQVSSAIICLLIRNIFLQRSEKVFDVLEKEYAKKELEEHTIELRRIRDWPKNNKPSGSKEVVDSFWTAWTAYSTTQHDYRQCVSKAIKFGNTTNIAASVAGCLGGLSNGLYNIPQKWLNLLRITTEAMDAISIFTNRIVRDRFS